MSSTEFQSQLSLLTPSLNNFAFNLTKDRVAAEDLYQDTAFRAISNSEKFQVGTNFKAWTFTIMKNIFINNYRKNKKRNTVIDKTENLYYLNSGSVKISNEVETNLSMEELNKFIEDLDDSLKLPFKRHFSGFKYQEIAEEMQLPLGTVKSRIFFARKAMKKSILRKYGDLETIRTKLTA